MAGSARATAQRAAPLARWTASDVDLAALAQHAGPSLRELGVALRELRAQSLRALRVPARGRAPVRGHRILLVSLSFGGAALERAHSEI
eukprot:8364797-Pyramimonas_sp.AAC.1